ncbi:MAG: hypothetical protein JW892_06285, partial [Anaerolineae bacterium]|nr:hypothetical protein [Anaerolineae bacterium]
NPGPNALLALQMLHEGRSAVSVSDLLRNPVQGIRSSSVGFCAPCEARSANGLLRQPRANALFTLQWYCAGRNAILVSDLLRKPVQATVQTSITERKFRVKACQKHPLKSRL